MSATMPLTRDGGQTVVALALVAGTTLASGLLDSEYWHHNFLLVTLFVAVAVLQNMLLADAGQVSFGQGAIFGIAAYAVGIASAIHGLNLLASFAVGIVFAMLLGLGYALPSLRVQGYYLGFVSLSAAVVFPELLVALDPITKGINGIRVQPTWLTEPLVGRITPLSLVILAFTCAVVEWHRRLRASTLGRRMRVAAQSPEAAQSLGISPAHMRFYAFLAAALGTGIAGVLYTPLVGFVSPYAFRVELSVYFFFAVIVGGNGQVLGPVIGAWLLYLVPNVLLVDLVDYRLLGYGVTALLIMLLFPDGVVGTCMRLVRSRSAVPEAEIGLSALRGAGTTVPRLEPAPAGTPHLEVQGATKRFGSVVALNGIDLTVPRGAIYGIVGPNGSGKTTLLNALSGFIRLDSGRLIVGGRDITRIAPHRLPDLGVARTFQTPRILDDMSVWDNVALGASAARPEAGANPIMDAVGALRPAWAAQSPASLQHARRRLLEVIRAAAMNPDLILLDEPAAGLAPDERRELSELLVYLRDALGKTIVLVEHDLSLVWRIADHVAVLDAGTLVVSGRPDAIRNDPRVQALFTGEQRA